MHYHAVEKGSTTTPIRIAFDCGCRQSAGYPSFDDCLEIGVPCSNDLCSILIHFTTSGFTSLVSQESLFEHTLAP